MTEKQPPPTFLKFIYFNWRLLHNNVVTFAIHSHESAMGTHVFPILNLPPHPIPQGHPCAPALSTLSHASNLDWSTWFKCLLMIILPSHSIHFLENLIYVIFPPNRHLHLTHVATQPVPNTFLIFLATGPITSLSYWHPKSIAQS